MSSTILLTPDTTSDDRVIKLGEGGCYYGHQVERAIAYMPRPTPYINYEHGLAHLRVVGGGKWTRPPNILWRHTQREIPNI